MLDLSKKLPNRSLGNPDAKTRFTEELLTKTTIHVAMVSKATTTQEATRIRVGDLLEEVQTGQTSV